MSVIWCKETLIQAPSSAPTRRARETPRARSDAKRPFSALPPVFDLVQRPAPCPFQELSDHAKPKARGPRTKCRRPRAPKPSAPRISSGTQNLWIKVGSNRQFLSCSVPWSGCPPPKDTGQTRKTHREGGSVGRAALWEEAAAAVIPVGGRQQPTTQSSFRGS